MFFEVSQSKRPKMEKMKQFLFVFSQNHANFRAAEFLAVCEIFGIFVDEKIFHSKQTHLYIFPFESSEPVKKILSRATLVRNAYEILFEAENFDKLEEKMKNNPKIFEPFNKPTDSWRFRFRPQGKKPSNKKIEEIRERFIDCMGNIQAPVDLNNAKFEYNIVEDLITIPESKRKIYFGITIGEGQLYLKTDYNLKDRKYIGNSTMDPELAFIQSNLVKARPNSLLLDPFCGTGGLLISAAHFGSTVIGTEINYMIARGEGKSARKGEKFLSKDQSISGNFQQYGLEKFLGDIIIGDASQHKIWKSNARFDAILADPPYGIREKGSKVGNKTKKEHWTLPGSVHEQHFPEKAKYSLNQVFLDLLDLAASRLEINGRIAFWFPVVRETYSENVLPRHNALEMIANCEQCLTKKGSRRLLTYKKNREPEIEEKAYVIEDSYDTQTFRQIIFVQNQPEN